MPRPSSFHSSNLCLYPTIHSCIRTFLSSADHPLFVYILQYVFFPSASLMCPLSTLVFVSEHHLLETSVPFESRPFSLFPLYYVFASESSSPSPLCTMVLPGSFNFDIFFQCFNPDHTFYFVFVSGSSTILFSGNVLV
jgi:hypothetical protein